jgi:hypothetical protein
MPVYEPAGIPPHTFLNFVFFHGNCILVQRDERLGVIQNYTELKLHKSPSRPPEKGDSGLSDGRTINWYEMVNN